MRTFTKPGSGDTPRMDEQVPGSVQADDDIGDAILRSLRRILRKVSEHSRLLARTGGLTVPQFLCLRAISASSEGELSVAQVAETVQLSPPTVSRIMDRLERAGCVQRERRSDDRRKVSLSITRSGKDRLAALPSPLHERFVERLNDLDATKRAAILLALDELVSMLEASDIDAAPVLMPGGDPKSETALENPGDSTIPTK